MKFATDSKGKSYVRSKEYRDLVDGVTAHTNNYEPLPVDDKGNVKKRGNDDSLYNFRPDLQREIPRGLSETIFSGTPTSVEEDRSPTEEVTQRELVRGFCKFSGRTEGDEDDSTPCSNLQPKDLDSLYTHVLRIEKLNGKFAVVRLVNYQGVIYLIGGSKGVHRRVRLAEFETDISKLDSKSQQLVVPILRSFYQQYLGCSEDIRLRILDHLSVRKYTLCGEYEDGQHIEELTGEPRLRWFGMAYSGFDFPKQTSLTGDILADLSLLDEWGLPTPKYELLTKSQDLANRRTERHLRGKEGYVKHYLRHVGGVGVGNYETVFVEKTKTTWYVLVRMLRQVINSCDNIMAQAPGKIASRLRARNSFLRLPETMLVVWYRLMLRFCQWFVDKSYTKDIIGITDNARGMGNIWAEFLRETPDVTDDFGDPLVYIAKMPVENLSQVYQKRLLVLFQGIPGIGKTTLAEWIKQHSWACETLEQDTFKGNSAACLGALSKMLAGDARVILLARNNGNIKEYSKYIRAACEAGWKTLVVTPSELTDDVAPNHKGELLKICEESVKTRTGHLTITDDIKPESKVRIVRSRLSKFKPAVISSEVHHLYRMPWLEYLDSSTEASRRSLESLGTELMGVISQKMLEAPEPIYLGLPIPADFRQTLIELIKEQMDISGEDQCLVDHLTLVHNYNMLSDPEHWSRVKGMVGQSLKIKVTGLNIKAKSHAVFQCQVLGRNEVDDSDLVLSGFPHITGVIPKGVGAVISVKLLRDNEFTDKYSYARELVCESQVTPYY